MHNVSQNFRENSCSPEPDGTSSEKPSDVIERLLEVGRYRSANGIRYDASESVEKSADRPDILSDSSSTPILSISEEGDDTLQSPPNATETNVQCEGNAREVPPAPRDFIIDVKTVLLWERILFGSS